MRIIERAKTRWASTRRRARAEHSHDDVNTEPGRYAAEQLALRRAVTAGLLLATIAALAAFVVSYSALFDVALKSRVPDRWVWLWPLLVDLPSIEATIALYAIGKAKAALRQAGVDPSRYQAYFWSVLVVSVSVSVIANAVHALMPEGAVLTPRQSVAVEVLPPIAGAIAIHGALLLKSLLLTITHARQPVEKSLAEAVPVQAAHVVDDTDLADVEACATGELDMPAMPAMATQMDAAESANSCGGEQPRIAGETSQRATDGTASVPMSRQTQWIGADAQAALMAGLESRDIRALADHLKKHAKLRVESEQIQRVLEVFVANPDLSQRGISRQTDVAHTTVPRIIHSAAEVVAGEQQLAAVG